MGNLKKWRVKTADPAMQYILSRQLGVSPLMAQLLINRGIYTGEAARQFLDSSMSGLHPPLLMKDMDKGVTLAARALEQKQKILVYGDYDVDGVTGTALLVEVLRRLGGDVEYFIPHRLEQGYGLHNTALEQARQKGVGLIITVDCGIGNAKEVAELKDRGGTAIIITDHHEPPAVLPAADAVINPKRRDCTYPFRELAGVGVAYKFARVLLEKCGCPAAADDYLDLVCLGTVADIVPLHGENRILVKHGLDKLARFERPGLQALARAAGLKTETPGTREVGFILAPRINAAGRLGDADTAVNLLLSEHLEEALELAAELGRNNQTRQELESVALAEAQGMLDGDPSLSSGDVLVLASPQWHPGVIGIVASRLVEKYHKPVLLVACQGAEGRGSARSVRGFDLMPALDYCRDCLLEFGGHYMAAGFGIETAQIENLRRQINEYAAGLPEAEETPDALDVDALVDLKDVTYELVNEIEMLRPHGHGNPRPMLGLPRAKLLNCRGVGKNEAHLKILLGENRVSIDGIGFKLGRYARELAAGKDISVAFTPTINEWQGRRNLQIQVNDLRGEAKEESCHCRSDRLTRQAGNLVFLPETMVARVKECLAQKNHPMPPEMTLLQAYRHPPGEPVTALPCPPPAEKSRENMLARLEPSEKCTLLLVNSAHHTLQLARFFECHNPRFAGQIAHVNGYMPAERIINCLHNINNGNIKLLLATYGVLPEQPRAGCPFDRVIMARPPATGEDWLGIASCTDNGNGVPVQAIYTAEDWEHKRSILAEPAPERDVLAGCYTALRSLSANGSGSCTAEEILDLLNRSGCRASSSLVPAVAAAIFSELNLLQYRWEEGMLVYKLIPAGGQRRELNASDTFNRTRELKAQWLDWIESGAQSNGT